MKKLFFLAAFAALSGQAFELSSNLKPGEPIPSDYYTNTFGCTGKSTSPRLEWRNEPQGTKSFAIVFYDHSAPTGSGFSHYVLFDIPANVHKIEEGDITIGKIPEGSKESITDVGKPGYFGPCPPAGRKHLYSYTVYALKTEKLGVPVTSTPAFVGFNLWSNQLAEASFNVTAGKAAIVTGSTEDIWNHHIEAWNARSVEKIVLDYSDDSRLVLNNKVFKGQDQIASAFNQLFKLFDSGSNRIDTPQVFDRFVYITWHFTPTQKQEYFGTDTFVIENGKIVTQTIASPLYDVYPIH